MNYLLNEEDLESKLNSAKLKSQLADYAAKDAESYKKAQEIMAKAYKQRIDDKNQQRLDHPVISGIEAGAKTGKSTFTNIIILMAILGVISGRLNGKIAGAIMREALKFSAKSALLVAGLAIPANYILKWLEDRNKKNESVGLRLLNRMNRLSRCLCEEEELNQEDLETDESLEDKIEDEIEDKIEDKVETSEALKKLRGHLYRFQEDKDGKVNVVNTTIGGAVGGGLAGNSINRAIHAKKTGVDKQMKGTAAKMKDIAKSQKHFADKAMVAKTKEKAAKAVGDVAKAQKYKNVANASANAVNKAGKAMGAAEKTMRGLKKSLNAAGRAGIGKGALIGGALMGGAALAKNMAKNKNR